MNFEKKIVSDVEVNFCEDASNKKNTKCFIKDVEQDLSMFGVFISSFTKSETKILNSEEKGAKYNFAGKKKFESDNSLQIFDKKSQEYFKDKKDSKILKTDKFIGYFESKENKNLLENPKVTTYQKNHSFAIFIDVSSLKYKKTETTKEKDTNFSIKNVQIKSHKKLVLVTCPYCSYLTTRSDNLPRHIRSKHQFICSEIQDSDSNFEDIFNFYENPSSSESENEEYSLGFRA